MKEDIRQIVQLVRENLLAHTDGSFLESQQRFFKEAVKLHGVRLPVAEKIGKSISGQVRTLPKSEIFELCDQLWQSGYLEEAVIASQWSELIHNKFEPDDFEVFERWISNNVTNWAACDTLCNHTVGEFIMKYPGYLSRLKAFTQSDNRWVRRASAVTLIIPARKGLFLQEIFEIADQLLMDADDLVQKGYGWMLKAASEAHQQEVFAFVMQRKSVMPRTALRYAIEKMPAEMKAEARKK